MSSETTVKPSARLRVIFIFWVSVAVGSWMHAGNA